MDIQQDMRRLMGDQGPMQEAMKADDAERGAASFRGSAGGGVGSRKQRRGKFHNQMLIALSAMATLALILFGIALFHRVAPSQHVDGVIQLYSADHALMHALVEANAAIADAQSRQDAARARHAIDLLDAVRDLANAFARIAKEQGWSEDQIDDKLSLDGLQQALGMRKLLEDIVVKVGQRSSP
jgi:hypothetical protein